MATLIKRHNVKVRFVVVGIWNTIFGYLAFVSLDLLFIPFFSKRYFAYMLAVTLSNIVAIVNAYFFHKYVTFKSPVRGKGMIIEFLRFSSTYLFSLCLGLVMLPFLVEILLFDPKIAGAILIPVATIISYLGHSRFSFKRINLKSQ